MLTVALRPAPRSTAKRGSLSSRASTSRQLNGMSSPDQSSSRQKEPSRQSHVPVTGADGACPLTPPGHPRHAPA